MISFIKPGHVETRGKGLDWYRRERIKKGKPYSDFLVLSAVELGFSWFVIGTFIDQENTFEKWRLSVFALDNMKEIKTQYEAQIASAKAFSLEKYIDSFVYDPSDTFDDDRILLERFLTDYRARKKYGRPVRSVKSM